MNYVDVKMTETNLPLFWGTGLVDKINAQARVQLFKATQFEGLLPVGVQNPRPEKVRAYIVDETNGTQIASQDLTVRSRRGRRTAGVHEHGAADVRGSGGHVEEPRRARRAQRRRPYGLSASADGAGAARRLLRQRCPDARPVIHPHLRRPADDRAAQVPPHPQLGSVYLNPGTCGNGSFNVAKTACTIEVVASVGWNAGVLSGDLGTNTKLTAKFTDGRTPATR